MKKIIITILLFSLFGCSSIIQQPPKDEPKKEEQPISSYNYKILKNKRLLKISKNKPTLLVLTQGIDFSEHFTIIQSSTSVINASDALFQCSANNAQYYYYSGRLVDCHTGIIDVFN